MLGRIRPGFEIVVEESAQAILAAFERRLRNESALMSGLVATGRIEVQVPRAEERLWSPQLIVDLEETSKGTHLRGRFGPHPSIWTLFMAGYGVLAAVAFMAAMFGIAELTMGTTPWSFALVPISLVLGAALYGLAVLGRDLGEEQMKKLRAYLEETLSRLQGNQVVHSTTRLKAPEGDESAETGASDAEARRWG